MPGDNRKTLILILIALIIASIYFAFFYVSKSSIKRHISTIDKEAGQMETKIIDLSMLSQDTKEFLDIYGVNKIEVSIKRVNKKDIASVIITPIYNKLNVEKYYLYRNKLVAFITENQETGEISTTYYTEEVDSRILNNLYRF